MKEIIKVKRIAKIIAILFLNILISGAICCKVQASTGGTEGSESSYTLTDSEGKYTGQITMRNGEIVIKTSANTASNSIRWKTNGLVASKVPLSEKTIKYNGIDLRGYQPLSTIKTAELPYNLNNKEDIVDKSTGITTTIYKLTAREVETSFGNANFDDITKDTPIYLHAIFDTYQLKDGKQSLRKQNIRSWEEIVKAETWGQVVVFRQYYNMRIEFQPAPQENIINYVNDSGITLANEKKLASKYPGENVEWTNEPKELTNKGIKYELYKYEVKSKDGKKSYETHTLGDRGYETVDKLQTNQTKVYVGGVRIYLYYREKKENYKIRLQAVDKETNAVINSNLYTGEVALGDAFRQDVQARIEVGGVTYDKTIYNSYTYVNKKNVTKTEQFVVATSKSAVSLKIPDDVKTGETIVVSVYYQKGSNTIPITINAINKSTGEKLTVLTTERVQPSTVFSYAVSTQINVDSKAYSYANEWKWYYKATEKSSTVISKSGTGTTISFTVPSNSEISKDGITIDIYYKIGSSEITLRTVMVSKSGAIIQEISKEPVTRNKTIKKIVKQAMSIDSIIYEYSNKWDYTYTNGNKETTTSGSGLNINFTIPSTTQLGSVVLLRIYYDGTEEVEIPEQQAPITLPLDEPSPIGVINGDKYKNGYFVSEDSIPTTESQYVYVQTKDYLLGYNIVNRVGKMTYYVPVTMKYTLHFKTATPEEYGGPKDVTDVIEDTQYIKVERAYSYWEIVNLEYYIINSAMVQNYSLPDGKVNLNVNRSLINAPDLIVHHSSNILDHLKEPRQVKEGITLESSVAYTSETSDRPVVEFEDLTAYALKMTDEILVCNDYLVFDGVVVLSDARKDKIAPNPNPSPLVHCTTITPEKALFTENQVIESTKLNGVYYSSGKVQYTHHPMSVQASIFGRSYGISVNKVTIHTPVICDPVIQADNDKWVQLVNPAEDVYHIVLDPDSTLNDFKVRISNTLHHNDFRGYTIRDFSRSFIDPDNISYIAKKEGVVRNEMKLPFDVYMDVGNDNKTDNDEFIKAGTWIILGRGTHRFYVPMWVQEGVYKAQFRTIAVNGEDKLSSTEVERNASRSNYVATSTKNFQISGRIYGFTIYDIFDYPLWEDVFRLNKTTKIKYFEGAVDGTKKDKFNKSYSYYYTVGTKNQYGVETGRLSKYTVPLVNSSHPQYKNLGVIKTGYAFRFVLDTVGEMYSSANSIKITPTFYFVDSKGKNRQPVDLYYHEEIGGKLYNLVKVGDGIDLINNKEALVGNSDSKIPTSELKHTANVLNTTYSKLVEKYAYMYNYHKIRVTADFRTFVGIQYAKSIVNQKAYKNVKENPSLTELDLSKYMQRWYGTYKLPVDLFVAPAGYDVYGHMRKYGITTHESFWLKDGYIIVNFNIVTIGKSGKENLSYINANNYLNHGHNSMWVTEGGVLQKTDNKDVTFNFKAGDVFIYYSSKSMRDDYEGVLN